MKFSKQNTRVRLRKKSSNNHHSKSKSKKIGNTRNIRNTKYQRTFIISARNDSNGLIYTQLRKRLIDDLKLEEVHHYANVQPYFIWMEQLTTNKFDAVYNNIPCWIKNILSHEKSIITNKYQLYNNFHNKYPLECSKYMAHSWNFLKQQPIPNVKESSSSSSIYIVRPAGVGAFSGKDVIIVHDIKTWKHAKSISKKYNAVIASDYIMSPMLFEGRKFHLRTYLIAAKINGIYKTYFFDFYELFTAAKPYKAGDFDNGDIHDTHFKSTPRDIMCPDDLNSEQRLVFSDKVYPAMKECMRYVSRILEEGCKPYPESENAFEVFGCDFMVTSDAKPILLEVNEKIGFTMHKVEKKRVFCERYFNTICDFLFTDKLEPLYLH